MTDWRLAELEGQSILDFVHSAANEGFMRGFVLDYGCGLGQYRRIVEEHGGEWHGYDRTRYGGSVAHHDITPNWSTPFDAVLCTQVIQYVLDPEKFMRALRVRLRPGGHLVMTYPTHWPELRDDLWRFTMLGMERLLRRADFTVVKHERRAEAILGFAADSERVALGYGVVARA